MRRTLVCICLALAVLVLVTVPAQADNTCTVKAGPIWNQQDADKKCPQVCDLYGPWTGQWWTTVPGEMSVCQCQANLAAVDAGPIWNQSDADKKCPATCGTVDGTWTGQWWTTVPNKMSVCQCAVCEPCKRVAQDAGPIWNQQDAEQKCPGVCQKNGGSWDGQWWTTVPGQMSVCQCVECP